MRVVKIANGVGMCTMYANVYLLKSRAGKVIADTGSINYTWRFRALLQAFKPDLIMLTHSHLDHSGNAHLAQSLGYKIVSHPLEKARLTGKSHVLPYPASAPQIGTLVSRMHPKLDSRALGSITEGENLLGWDVVHLPGHTDGQSGLFRGGVLIAGDAVFSDKRGAHLPRKEYNWNHGEAQQSLSKIVSLQPKLILAGHGAPLSLEQVKNRLKRIP